MGHWVRVLSLVPRDKVFKAFQNIWAWKPSGHVTNILISSYLKVYLKKCVKKAKWFLLLALKLTFTSNMSRPIHGHYLIHTMMCLM